MVDVYVSCWLFISSPVHVSKFLTDNVHIMTGGDDKTIRLFDIPAEKEVLRVAEHQVGNNEFL